MHTVQTNPAPRGAQHGRGWSGWPLAITGLVLLVASVVMMAARSKPVTVASRRNLPLSTRSSLGCSA